MTELAQLSNWNETKLWHQLKNTDKAEAETVRATLTKWMPKIQQLLAYSGTSPSDFTLHDSQHAFRVAERMAEIISNDVFLSLSTYELALLLFSAYLHDIGMSPNKSLVKSLYNFLLFEDSQDLTVDEIDSFRKWIDGQEDEINIPLVKSTSNSYLLRKASLLVSQYSRANHVEWAEKWINTNFSNEKLGTYAQWVADLRMICRSHHEGYSELMSDDFDPKPVGSVGMIVHPRYLAAILRVSDILEFDPERTPDVIFEQRDISIDSIIYWHKDHHVSRRFENGRLSISAEPPGARIHRAIEIMSDEIEAELRLVRRLDDERPFEIAKFQEEKLYHRWGLLPDIRRDIRPQNNGYEYINGSFRPDTRKVLQLLSGKELYGNELVALREILQNAFDAVREEIALQRLEKQDPSNQIWKELLESMHLVNINIDSEDNRIWLTCTDDGAGMSKSIITNNLLISGNSRRRDVRILERRCKEHGFEMERTGQFGIGVLSYFMVADFVQIQTKRSSLANDAESTGWHFETDGISSFGELRKDHTWRQGTRVRLRLRQDLINRISKKFIEYVNILDNFEELEKKNFGEYQEIFNKAGDPRKYAWWGKTQKDSAIFTHLIISYIKNILSLSPCKLIVQSNCEDQTNFEMSKGWATDSTNLVDISSTSLVDDWEFRRLFTDDSDLIPLRRKQINDALRKIVEDLPKKIKESLTWKTLVGDLPNQLGVYRIHIPIFNLGENKSNFYFDIISENVEGKIIRQIRPSVHESNEFVFKPEGRLDMSWKGMKVYPPEITEITHSIYERGEEDAIIEIDWQDSKAGTLSVSREKISISDIAREAIEWIRSNVVHAYEEFVIENNDSLFVLLTNILISKRGGDKREYWLYRNNLHQGLDAIWGKVKFPAIDVALGTFYYLRIMGTENSTLHWMDQPIIQLDKIGLNYSGQRRIHGPVESSWASDELFDVDADDRHQRIAYPPDRLVVCVINDQRFVTGIWFNHPSYRMEVYDGFRTHFPPEWNNVVGVQLTYDVDRYVADTIAWNIEHPLVYDIGNDAVKWAIEVFKDNSDPRKVKDVLLSDKEKARAWVLLAISNDRIDLWNALVEQDKHFLSEIWKLIFGENAFDKKLVVLSEGYGSASAAVFTSDNAIKIYGKLEVDNFAPDPGAEWTIYFSDNK